MFVVGQLLAVYEHAEKQKPNVSVHSAVVYRLDDERLRRKKF